MRHEIMNYPFFEDFFGNDITRNSNKNLMKTNIVDNGDHYEFEIELPKVKKENVKVSVEDGYLTVSAEYNSEESEKNKNSKFLRKECFYSTTSRNYYVGEGVTEEMVTGKLENGVLTLEVKKPVETKPVKRYIEIK